MATEKEKLEEIYSFVKDQKSDLDVLVSYIKKRETIPFFKLPSKEAIEETGLSLKSRAIVVLTILEDYYKLKGF
jgi:hypothetical protein